ncbi:hypothetical protein M5689_000048 [Euphorbia peplus]|nr:hypothetical protein M5689_000048 [Euphorbia peplus]
MNQNNATLPYKRTLHPPLRLLLLWIPEFPHSQFTGLTDKPKDVWFYYYRLDVIILISTFGSPFGSQSVFGQTNNANNSTFAPEPFGSTTPSGSQTGGSLFGGTSTDMFGAASSPAFGSSTTSFGATSASAFGSSSTSYGGSSLLGQNSAFGGFGSNTQTSPFGSTSQPSQPAFGSYFFGSTAPFGASSQPAFSAASSPRFGSDLFGSPAIGVTGTSGFGASGIPSFGAISTPTFGTTAPPAFGPGGGFGVSTSSGFGATSSTPPFSSTSAFGPQSTPSFNFGSSPSFGQSTFLFGNTQFGPSPFTAQSSPFSSNAGFGQTGFAGNRGGSRYVAYSPTEETNYCCGLPGNLESISAMPTYKDISHEELKWEDYQSGDKGNQYMKAIDEAPVKTDCLGGSSSCIICREAPVEGACIPCGHMAGCMACLNKIKRIKGVCPVCRAKIEQAVKLYAV